MSDGVYRSRVLIVRPDDDLPSYKAEKVRFKSPISNAGYIWINTYAKAEEGECYPLDVGERTPYFYIECLTDISLHFENEGDENNEADKVIIIYERNEVNDERKED